MTLEGIVVNGLIVVQGGTQLPEGTRVRIEVAEADDIGPPLEPYNREKEVALLRQALEDVRAGRGMAFEEFMSQLAADCNLPPVPPE